MYKKWKLENHKVRSVIVGQLSPTLCYSQTVARRHLCLWDSPGKNIGAGCHAFSRESSGPRDQTSVFCNVDSLPTESPGKPEPEVDRKYKNLHLGTRKIHR